MAETPQFITPELLREIFTEATPLYGAQSVLEKWIAEHGFLTFHLPDHAYGFQENTEGKIGMVWGKVYHDYGQALNAILDEIVRRAAPKEIVPNG